MFYLLKNCEMEKEDVYNKTTQMAYDLAFLKVDFDTNFGLTYIGGNGIEHPNEV